MSIWDPERDCPLPRDQTVVDTPEWARPRRLSGHSLPVGIHPLRARQAQLGLSFENVRDSTLNDSIDELGATWDLLAALNCRNVGVQRQAAPTALNKKRLKSGKLPFRETLFLDIALESSARDTARSASGSHASPRAHLRRGPIRRLAPTEKREARSLWINATHVGSGTAKAKTYRVHSGLN